MCVCVWCNALLLLFLINCLEQCSCLWLCCRQLCNLHFLLFLPKVLAKVVGIVGNKVYSHVIKKSPPPATFFS